MKVVLTADKRYRICGDAERGLFYYRLPNGTFVQVLCDCVSISTPEEAFEFATSIQIPGVTIVPKGESEWYDESFSPVMHVHRCYT